MRNRGTIYIAIFIIVAGVVLLLGNIFNLNLGAFCLPVGLILLGLFVLLRPRAAGEDMTSRFVLIGDIERSGPGELTSEEVWGFIVESKYDLTKVKIPPGETIMRGYAFVSDVEIYAPADIGVEIIATSFVTEFKLDGGDEETNLLTPFTWKSDGYKMMERRVRFELYQFVGDIKARHF